MADAASSAPPAFPYLPLLKKVPHFPSPVNAPAHRNQWVGDFYITSAIPAGSEIGESIAENPRNLLTLTSKFWLELKPEGRRRWLCILLLCRRQFLDEGILAAALQFMNALPQDRFDALTHGTGWHDPAAAASVVWQVCALGRPADSDSEPVCRRP